MTQKQRGAGAELEAADREVTHEQRWADAVGLLAERALAKEDGLKMMTASTLHWTICRVLWIAIC